MWRNAFDIRWAMGGDVLYELADMDGRLTALQPLGKREDMQQAIGALQAYFKEHGYATTFRKARYIMTPILFLNIYKGRLGEIVGSWILQKYGHLNLSSIQDLTYYEKFDRELPSAGPAAQAYPTSIAGATASIVSSVVANYPVEVDRLTQDEKMDIMETLSRKGVFLLKGSVSYVAKELHSSEASIYRYLGKLNSRQK